MSDDKEQAQNETEARRQGEAAESPRLSKKQRIAAFARTRKGKISLVAAGLVILTVVVAAVPPTRYAVAGLFIKKNVTVTVTDSTTKKPVTDATVKIGRVSAMTDKEGIARVKDVPAGRSDVVITKKYYVSGRSSVLVPILSSPKGSAVSLKANGRPVSFTVTDSISGARLANVTFAVSGTSATTGKSGEATVVVPDKGDMNGTLTAGGYNDTKALLHVGDGATNSYSLTPSGQIVFLNNANGTIDVRRSNLDGSGSTVLVAGTGKENKFSTGLLSARDWKFSVLKASRDSGQEKLYLVTSASGNIEAIDEGDATFNLVGWAGHTFYYTVDRTGSEFADKAHALKGYDADTSKLTTIDQTSGNGTTSYYDYRTAYQQYGSIYILPDELVYTKNWASGYDNQILTDKSASLYSLSFKTNKVTDVKDFPQQGAYLGSSLYEPQGVYLSYSSPTQSLTYYEYEDGKVEQKTDVDSDAFNNYPTFLYSPSTTKTFWYEQRNGKNTIFIGDAEGKNPRQIATLSEYVPYGWYGDKDQYVLFTKNGSELYIAPAGAPIPDKPLKVTDYYKVQTYRSYGGGYGGQ